MFAVKFKDIYLVNLKSLPININPAIVRRNQFFVGKFIIIIVGVVVVISSHLFTYSASHSTFCISVSEENQQTWSKRFIRIKVLLTCV